jgi:hypothetical protein
MKAGKMKVASLLGLVWNALGAVRMNILCVAIRETDPPVDVTASVSSVGRA